MADTDHKTTTSLLVKIVMGMASFGAGLAVLAAGWSFSASQANTRTINAAVAARELRDTEHDAQMKMISYKLEQLTADRDLDVEQNRRLDEHRATHRKFWKLLNWFKSQLNKMLAADSKPLVEWPDIGTSE